jgi:hypothetical protein
MNTLSLNKGERLYTAIQVLVGESNDPSVTGADIDKPYFNDGLYNNYSRMLTLRTARDIGSIPVKFLFLTSRIPGQDNLDPTCGVTYRLSDRNTMIRPRHLEIMPNGYNGIFGDPSVTSEQAVDQLMYDLSNLGE